MRVSTYRQPRPSSRMTCHVKVKVQRTGVNGVAAAPRRVATRRAAAAGARRAARVAVRAAEDAGAAAVEEVAAAEQEANVEESSVSAKLIWGDLVVGSKLQGAVTSVKDFGAFVSFGGPCDGLVHISQLTNAFVKNVGDVVQPQQEVEVRILAYDEGAKRIELSMIDESEKPARREQRQGKKGGGRGPRDLSGINEGDAVSGKVKSVLDFGIFVEIKEGVDGLLHKSAMEAMPEGQDFQDVYAEGSIVDVIVEEISGGKIKLRSPNAERGASDSKSRRQRSDEGSEDAGSERRPKSVASPGTSKQFVQPASALELAFMSAGVSRSNIGLGLPSSQEEREAAEEVASLDAAIAEAQAAVQESQASVDAAREEVAVEEEAPTIEASAVAEPEVAEPEVAEPEPAAEAPAADEPEFKVPAKMVKELREMTGSGMMDCKKALVESKGDVEGAVAWLRKKGIAKAEKKASRTAAEGMIHSYIHAGSKLGVLLEVNCETDFAAQNSDFKELVDDVALQIAACPQVDYVNPEDADAEFVEKERALAMDMDDIKSKPENIRGKIVDGRVSKIVNERALMSQPFVKDSNLTMDQVVKAAIARIGENIKVRRFVRFNLGEGIEVAEKDFAAEVEEQAKAFEAAAAAKKDEEQAAEESPAEAAAEAPAADEPEFKVPAKMVKELREMTGSGMMDCKKALVESKGDVEGAVAWLRKKGIAKAEKKASRTAAEGMIHSYIHAGSKLGVLLEVNCETDFAAQNSDFKELVDDVALQIAACPQVDYVNPEDADAEFVEKERALAMDMDDIKSKPENIRGKIVDGRVSKIVNERALMSQPFVKDSNLTMDQVVKAAIARIGENIKVRRFVRFNLGEGIEKKEANFAEEVAAAARGE